MLETAQSRGIVDRVTNIVDEYLENKEALATSLPYFEGDYWVGEIENLVDDIEREEKASWKTGSKKGKKRNNARATRTSASSTDVSTGTKDPLREVKQYLLSYFNLNEYSLQCLMCFMV